MDKAVEGDQHELLPNLLTSLLNERRLSESLEHIHKVRAKPSDYAEWPNWADKNLVAGYARRGVERPWTHQVQAAEAAWAGKHVVIATSTGSGKSLACWLPAVTAIRSAVIDGSLAHLQRRPTVLYLSPTKALAADQLHGLVTTLEASNITDVRAATCDGDTPSDERTWVRDWADIVMTNPDFLHFSMLAGHKRWQRFLRGLSYVVIDECHAYRGILGAHVALVLRRLLRLAKYYGASPVVMAASATTARPRVTASRLIGAPEDDIVEVTKSGAPRGETTIALWQPGLLPGVRAILDEAREHDREGSGEGSEPVGHARSAEVSGPAAAIGLSANAAPAALADVETEALTALAEAGVPEVPRRSALSEASYLLTDLVGGQHRTLAFVRSRVGAEAIAERTRAMLQDRFGPDLAGKVAAYRGGYLPEERRELERDLRTGDLLALASTNALELGVDISGLDAVVIAGWPGTRVSFWQQTGRAGRAGADGTAILIASDNPLDSYLIHHPEAIFETEIEETTFDPANPYVLAPHLCAAAAERPLTEADIDRFGPGTMAVLRDLVASGYLRKRPGGWYWNYSRPEHPASLTDLRGAGGQPVQVIEAGTGKVLGTVDAARADATVHTGAIYVHQGRTFTVLDYGDDVAQVSEVAASHRTRAHSDKHVSIIRSGPTKQWGPITWTYGVIDVTEQVTGYDRRRLPGMELIGTYPLDLPLHTLRTTAVWWHASPSALADLGLAEADYPGSLHAAEHAAIGLLGLIATCDRWDIGGLSTAMHADTEAPTVFVYDALAGGAGFAHRGFQAAARWMRATHDAVASCECSHGCPRCIQSPKCGNNNSPLDKAGALKILRLLADLGQAAEA